MSSPALPAPPAKARRGDLVVNFRQVPGRQRATIDVGVVLRADPAGWVTAFETSGGCTQPVAFLPGPAQLRLLLVPLAAIDVAAAVKAANGHGPFTSLDEVRAATRPLLRARRKAGPMAGS